MKTGRVSADLLRDARVVAAPCCGSPGVLLEQVGDVAAAAVPVTLSAGLLMGAFPLEESIRAGAVDFTSWHLSGPLRRLVAEDIAAYLPLRAGDVARHLIGRVDVALVRVSPPDGRGRCSLGPSTSYGADLVREGRYVVAEVDASVPRTGGAAVVALNDLDLLVDADGTTPVAPTAKTSANPATQNAAQRIAEQIAELLPTRATVQLGIGSVSEALVDPLTTLAPHRRWSLLGMVTEAMVDLAEATLTAGADPVLAVELLGGPSLMAWADGHPRLDMITSADVATSPLVGRSGPVVSVNSALAVDLTGQVLSERVGGRTIGGIGGSLDFFDAARRTGGLRVVALASTTGSGASTIVAGHEPGDPVTIPHHQVDVVVTEHGVAWLRDADTQERRERLLAIADPRYRDELARSTTRCSFTEVSS